MPRLFLLLLTALTLTAATAQNSLQRLFDGTSWTDGDIFYRAELTGNFVNMFGGSLHEGGYAFGLQCTDAKTLTFSLQEGFWNPTDRTEGSISFPCQKGAVVEARTFDADTYLLVNNKQGEAIYSFRLMKPGETGRELIARDLVRAIEGKYTVRYSKLDECPNGTACSITADRIDLGNYTKGSFEVMEMFECPTDIFRLPNGQFIKIRPAGNPDDLRFGLSIYLQSYDAESELYGDDRLILVLDRVSGNQPHWPETSTQVLLPGQITAYPRPELRVMRNEIFARHGYRFNDRGLVSYFESEPWYQPGADIATSNKIQLSAIETINVSLIRAAENNKGFYMPELDEEAFAPGIVNYDDDLYRTDPWTDRRVLQAHAEYFEVEILPDLVKPYDLKTSQPQNLTFEWCKAEGSYFKVGLSHLKRPGQSELKHVVIRQNGTDLAYPMIRVGDEDPLPEVTIRIQGGYLWLELKSASNTRYYFYNLDTHVLSRSDSRAYQNRTAPANANDSWRKIVTSQLSPKAY